MTIGTGTVDTLNGDGTLNAFVNDSPTSFVLDDVTGGTAQAGGQVDVLIAPPRHLALPARGTLPAVPKARIQPTGTAQTIANAATAIVGATGGGLAYDVTFDNGGVELAGTDTLLVFTPGTYKISACVNAGVGAGGATGNPVVLNIFKNGVIVGGLSDRDGLCSFFGFTVAVTVIDSILLAEGDLISMQIQNLGGDVLTITNANTWLSLVFESS